MISPSSWFCVPLSLSHTVFGPSCHTYWVGFFGPNVQQCGGVHGRRMNLTLIRGWTCSTTRQCFQIQFMQSHWLEERLIFLEGMQVQQEYYWYPSLPKKAFSEMKGCRVLKTPPTSNHTAQKMHSKWAKSTIPLNKLSPSERVQNNKTSIRSKRITQIYS